MNIEELREYCLNKAETSECFPFDEETLVFKINSKMFLLVSINEKPISFNVKCEPENAIALREKYSCVTPGYHMNKKHWNTVVVDGSVSESEIKQWIDESYELVSKKSAKTTR